MLKKNTTNNLNQTKKKSQTHTQTIKSVNQLNLIFYKYEMCRASESFMRRNVISDHFEITMLHMYMKKKNCGIVRVQLTHLHCMYRNPTKPKHFSSFFLCLRLIVYLFIVYQCCVFLFVHTACDATISFERMACEREHTRCQHPPILYINLLIS